jgi:hypothetical protein
MMASLDRVDIVGQVFVENKKNDDLLDQMLDIFNKINQTQIKDELITEPYPNIPKK